LVDIYTLHGGTKEETEMQVKLGEVPKHIYDLKMWVRGVRRRKMDSLAS